MLITAADLTVPTCGKLINFDISTTAASYSTLAGVLAGFAFASLMVIITIPEKDRSKFVTPAQALGAAFIGLILTSVSYAVLAGDASAPGRAATEEDVAGLGFAICALQLIYAMALTFEAGALAAVAQTFRTVASIFICPLGMLLLVLGVQDYHHAHPAHTDSLMTLGFVLTAVLLALSCLFWFSTRGNRRSKLPRTDNTRTVKWESAAALVALAASVISVSLLEGHLGGCQTISPTLMYLVVILSFLLLSAAAYIFAWLPSWSQGSICR